MRSPSVPVSMAEDADAPFAYAEEGVWFDTYPLHVPAAKRRAAKAGFDRGVGNGGYDRGEGSEVPKDPVLRRPGEAEPAADPFREKGHGNVRVH